MKVQTVTGQLAARVAFVFLFAPVVSPANVSADDATRAEFLRQYGNAASRYESYFSGKCVSGTTRDFDARNGGETVAVAKFDFWGGNPFFRLDLSYSELKESEIKNPKLSYVNNDYFSFTARKAADAREFAMIHSEDADSKGTLTAVIRSHAADALGGYCHDGVPFDEFVKRAAVVCLRITSDTWGERPCSRLQFEYRRGNQQVLYTGSVYYTSGPQVAGGWRCIGLQFANRNVRDRQPLIEEYTNSFDEGKSQFVPARVRFVTRLASEKPERAGLKKEFELESVTDDPKPKSFFTLTEFGLPEPGEVGVRKPFYREVWFYIAVAVPLVAAGIYIARRRRRTGGGHAA